MLMESGSSGLGKADQLLIPCELEKGWSNLDDVVLLMHAESLPEGELLSLEAIATAAAATLVFDDQPKEQQELLSSSFQAADKTSLLLASLHHHTYQPDHFQLNNAVTPSPLGTSEQTNSPHNGTFTLTSSSLTSLQQRKVVQTCSGSAGQDSSGPTTLSTTEFPTTTLHDNNSLKENNKVSKKVDFDIPPDMEESTTAVPVTHQLGPVIPAQLPEDQENQQGAEEKKKLARPRSSRQGSPCEDSKKGGHSSSNGRRSRSPGGNIMREIRKMSLASQDAREEKKKKKDGKEENVGSGSAQANVSNGNGGAATSTAAGGGPSPGKVSKRQARRRKRKEEEYTDKDRAAAVTLGSRDIKQSLKAKKKRERKLRISVDLLHNEEFLSGMLVVEAAYQMRVKKQTKEALTTLNKALELQPTHKGALVARSQCHLKLGDATAALRDAEASFDGNDVYIMGLYQYAEALYNLGLFEKALIAYHRGYRIRKLESFRIGIQKSQDAIQRAIGDCRTTPMEDLEEILPLIDELEVSTILRTQHRGSGGGNSGSNIHNNNNIPTSDVLANKQQNDSVPAGGTSVSQGIGGGGELRLDSGRESGEKSSNNTSGNAGRARWVAREVLGQMYFDKDYLTKFLLRKDIQADHGASHQLRANATEALNYLEIREQFWRQQNPMYTRKQGLSHNNKNCERKLETCGQIPTRSEHSDTVDSCSESLKDIAYAVREGQRNGGGSSKRQQQSSGKRNFTPTVSQKLVAVSSSGTIPLVLVNETSETAGTATTLKTTRLN